MLAGSKLILILGGSRSIYRWQSPRPSCAKAESLLDGMRRGTARFQAPGGGWFRPDAVLKRATVLLSALLDKAERKEYGKLISPRH